MSFSDWKLGRKMYAGYMAVALIFAAAALYQIYQTGRLAGQQDLGVKSYEEVLVIKDVAMRLNEVYAVIADSVINRDLKQSRVEFEEARAQAGKDIETVRRIAASVEGGKLADTFAAQYSAYLEVYEKKMRPLLQSDGRKFENMQDISRIDDEVDSTRDSAITTLREIDKAVTRTALEADKIFDVVRKNIIIISAVITALGLGLGLLIAFLVTRGITGPVREAAETADRLSEGDLTVRVEARGRDEIGQMLTSIQNMVSKLNGIAGQTKAAASGVSVAADQIASANQNYSQQLSQQAGSVQQTSATMEEMSASIRHTAENAEEANKLAQATSGLSEAGIAVMTETVLAMDEINKSSSRIASISGVIEEIAFQTNLLALNAAVEAARAGEHGKGFAVVASEIRSLAQRASQSAREITGLIEESVDKTGRGVKLARELNVKLNEISKSVKKVTDLMDDVASAAQEQSMGVNQVNKAVSQIDRTTQQNASLVEETSAATEELAAEARGLEDLMSFFKTDEEPPMTASPLRRSPNRQRPLKRISGPEVARPAEKPAGVAQGPGSDGDFEEF